MGGERGEGALIKGLEFLKTELNFKKGGFYSDKRYKNNRKITTNRTLRFRYRRYFLCQPKVS